MIDLDPQKMLKVSQSKPQWYINNVIGNQIWYKQQEIIESVKKFTRTTVRSCNGAGKSFISANIVAWFLGSFPESIVITTAPTSRQVEEILWQEIAKIHSKSAYPLGGTLLKTKWDMGPKWFALGLSTNDANRFQGYHAPHILAVLDEACGIDKEIHEAVEAIVTSEGGKVLLIGNPTEPDNDFFRTFSSPLYNKIHISAFHTPNFRNIPDLNTLRNMSIKELESQVTHPYLITPKWARERLDEWGEESPAFLARVLGEFPDTGEQTLIPLSWVMRALNVEIKDEPPAILGVDVARFGSDDSVIATRRGNSICRLESFSKLDTVEIADHVAHTYSDTPNCELIAVDSVGIGAGVADMLRKKGLPAIDIESGEKAYQSTRFINKRTEMWYRVRELLRKKEINLPDHPKATGELTSVRYSFDKAGRYVLETKKEMKARGLASPNFADAIVYSFAFDGKYQSLIASEQTKMQGYSKGTYGYLLKQLEKELKQYGGDNPWGF